MKLTYILFMLLTSTDERDNHFEVFKSGLTLQECVAELAKTEPGYIDDEVLGVPEADRTEGAFVTTYGCEMDAVAVLEAKGAVVK